MSRRILSLLLAVTLIFSAVPVFAHAENTDPAAEITEPAAEAAETNAKGSDPAELSEDQFQSYVAAVSAAPKSDALESADYSKAECAMSNFGISMADVGDNTMNEVESNNSAALADRVYNDYTVSGRLSSYDLDYYKFVLSSASTVNILSVANYSSTKFALCNSSGNVMYTSTFDGYSSGGYACQYITKSLSAGTYYLYFINTSNYSDTYTFYITYSSSSSHTHSYSASTTAPTCTAAGYTTYTCSCGASYTSNTVAATGHSYGSYISDNNGTPDSEGTKSATCSTCGSKNTVADTGVHLPNAKMLAPLGHLTGNILYWEPVTDATLYQVFRLNNGTWELLANTRGTAYKDETAPAGVKSYYKVRVRQDDLMSSMAIPSVSVTRPAPVTKLDNVTITSINAHTTGNIIYWNAVPNATLYQVYRLKGSSWELLKNTGSTAYKDEIAPVGVRSYYKIVARNGDLSSNISTTVSASAIRPAPLTSLSNVTITSINGHKSGNIIYWNAVANAKLYQVYRLNGSSWELLKNTSGTAYKDEAAPCGVRSYYKIVARNGDIASNISTTTSTSAVRAHDYSITDSASVSCTSNGYTTYACNTCGNSYTNTVTATGHSWVDATCTEPKTCSNCGATSGAALGHQGEGAVCTRCGGSTFDDIEYIGWGNVLIRDIVMPTGNYLITLDNYSTSRMVFVYLYNWNESSWEKSMSVDDYGYEEMIYTGSLNGYIEVDCGDSDSYWILTITRLS